MHNPEFVPENETHKILWDFEKQTDHLISARRPDLEIVNKKKKRERERTCQIVDFAVPADYRVKPKESEKRDMYVHLTRELKKNPTEHESDSSNNWNLRAWYSHQRISTWNGELENKRKSADHPNYSVIEVGQNTEKSPGNLWRLAVNETLLENHQLTLVWKSLKVVK